MSQTISSQRLAARPIRALIIQPDDTYELREIDLDFKTLQGIVGGFVEYIPTEHCILWRDKDGPCKGAPRNMLATFFWWKLCEAVTEGPVLHGPVFVTGLAEGEDPLPVSDEVVDLFERVRAVYKEHLED